MVKRRHDSTLIGPAGRMSTPAGHLEQRVSIMTEGAEPTDNLITVEELDDVEHEIITAKRRGSESGDSARRDSVLSEKEEESLTQGANILSAIKEKIFEQADCRHVLRLFRRQFFRRRELAMLDEAGAEQRAAKQKVEDRKKAILHKQQSAAFKRTGPEWEHPNEALERLRKNPMNGAVAPSDLGGQHGIPFSEADRWAPVIGDQGHSEASHIPPGFYFNPQVADGFAPENLPNFFTSDVPRFQAVVGDTGVGNACLLTLRGTHAAFLQVKQTISPVVRMSGIQTKAKSTSKQMPRLNRKLTELTARVS